MTSRASLIEMTAAARAAIADPSRITLVGRLPEPRFELFHAASSLCSQKVRTVLHEKALSYRSNDMLILSAMGSEGLIPAEHYSPAYIRLRLVAARELNREFVSGYSGRTSVETEGFDPCVVPLLVDYEAGRVIADSQRICIYLDGVSRTPLQLVPDAPAARAEVMRQVGIVDRIPNGALLYGFHPDADLRPEVLKASMQTVYDYKVMALERLVADNAGEPELVAAYRAKIAKESGGKKVCHDAAFQRAARQKTGQLLSDLERDLAAGSFGCTRGHSFSLADVLWGVNLVRLNYLGLASMWDALPHVTRYFDVLARRPSLCKEAIRASLDSMPHSRYMDAVADCTAEAVA
ncbi:glutathione S-transferase [Variovorax boronicumulans]|uniref:Glutathione S-transferase n=1 Tax=Variovorax boronicumulans TaxID=436515 RepID=A0AAW8CR61_9BURK|nr:glutathione S-transferase family protein [Variovorax boronicumulans]MDP9890955.1 glutathione S-transferase [Variovorax boronicumulans]MDQ0051022.1 glutathione S-transferase [Variovorax boronicumulans]